MPMYQFRERTQNPQSFANGKDQKTLQWAEYVKQDPVMIHLIGRIKIMSYTGLCSQAFKKWFSSVQFSRSVVSDSLQPHELQHTRPPCPSPTPRVHPDSRPLSQWCHPAISSSVVPFSSSPNPSQHQSLFQWVNSSHEVAKVLEFQL